MRKRKQTRYPKRLLSALLAVVLLVFMLSVTVFATTHMTHIKITLNAQNGSGGTSEVYVETGGALPAITPPTRRGYTFAGYWSAASGKGTQYYDTAGKPLKSCDFNDTAALYAHWTIRSFAITYENMDGATLGANAPLTHTYGRNTAVSDPAKPGYVFFGWQINGSAISAQGLTLGANAYSADITLTAVWNRAALVTLVDNATETVTMLDDDLRQVFHRQVTDPTLGITADDLNSEEVRLTMTAADADELAEGAKDILTIVQGEVLKFYDFSVTKRVTKLAAAPVITPLKQLPNTVQVEITLGAALQGHEAYRVYRYHNGVAEAIPHGPVTDTDRTRESFALSEDGAKLILHTSRLSTYAVVGSEKSTGGVGTVENDSVGMDVQARMMDGGDGPVYKVDIVWGSMRFTYSTGKEWNPDEHRYTDVRIYDWIPESCYTGGNNLVTVFNHSNADVLVGFEVTPILKSGEDMSLLDGVDMVMNTENKADAPPAVDVLLPRVPTEGATAPSVGSYLRLNGSPTDSEFYKGLVTDQYGYVQVADIAVTIGHLDGPRTPKK